MAGISAAVYSQAKKKVTDVNLPETFFGALPKIGLVHELIRQQLASKRSGTHSTKSKGEVRGGGIKPFRQKGTGNARQGSTRSSIMVGGGVAFGPKPRDYSYSVPKKKKWGAISVLFTDRLKNKKFHIVDKLEIKDGKTKSLLTILEAFDISNGLVLDIKNEMLKRAARNLRNVKYLSIEGINPYDIILHENVLATKDAIEWIVAREKSND